MTIENTIRMIAGLFVLTSLTLGWFVNPAWLLFTGFVGLNLLQSSITGWCPAEMLLKVLFFKQTEASCHSNIKGGTHS